MLKQNNQVCERQCYSTWKQKSFPVLHWVSLGISVKVNGQCIEKFRGKDGSLFSLFCFPFPVTSTTNIPNIWISTFFFLHSRGVRTIPGLGDIVLLNSLYMHTRSPNILLAGIIFVVLLYWAILVGVVTVPIWNNGRNGVAVQLLLPPRMVRRPIVLTTLPRHLSKLYYTSNVAILHRYSLL